jgi:hypothetical protein
MSAFNQRDHMYYRFPFPRKLFFQILPRIKLIHYRFVHILKLLYILDFSLSLILNAMYTPERKWLEPIIDENGQVLHFGWLFVLFCVNLD